MKIRWMLVLILLIFLPSSGISKAGALPLVNLRSAQMTLSIYQTKIEIVTDNAVTGDGGNSWGGHQTRIVHTKDGVFTAYTVEGGGYFNREWRLAQRQANGAWNVIAQDGAGREPVNLLASPDGTLHIIGWPNGVGTMWSGKPVNGVITMTSTTVPNVAVGYWPYNSAGIDEAGNICVLSSTGGENPGGTFAWACYLPLQTQWITGTSNLDYRYCYTYVFPDPVMQLSLVSTRDVRWSALGYQKPPGAGDYVYNAFRYWRTGNIALENLQQLAYKEELPTYQYPNPYLNAQMDAYLDTKDRMHILYWQIGETTGGNWKYRHQIVSPSGTILYDVEIPQEAGFYSRIFQDKQEQFYLLGSSGRLYPLDQEGVSFGDPVLLDLGGYQVEYSGFGLSVPRTGTNLSDVMNVVFPSSNETKWIYFQLHFFHNQVHLPIILR